jgi:hypothetical protein
MKKLLATLLVPALLGTSLAQAQTPTFDPATNVMTLPSLLIGSDTYTGVKVRLDAITLIAATPPAAPAPSSCTDANFTDAIWAKVSAYDFQPAVALETFVGIIGCQPSEIKTLGDATRWQWTSSQSGKYFRATVIGKDFNGIFRGP